MVRRQVSPVSGHAALLCGWLVLLLLTAPGPPILAQDLVVSARERYNEKKYDDAIELAGQAWRETRSTAASLVLARSRLERFRLGGDVSDLDAARNLLRATDPRTLSGPERREWELGLAASLYLHGTYGPAAEILDRLLREGVVAGADRERLVDWWASAVDRAGHQLDLKQRTRAYDRLAQRLESELGRNPASSAATYWLIEAVRGTGDLERAWSLGVAGWVRAGTGNTALRNDIERLLLQGVIPDLAVSRTDLPVDSPDTIAVMAQLALDWEATKAQWEAG